MRRNAHIEWGPRGSGDEGGARRSAAAAPPATRSCCSFPHTFRRTPLSPLLPSHLSAHICIRSGLLLAHLIGASIQPPSASNFPPNRPASLCCTPAAFPRARSFDLEVTRWAPTRLTSCIFHPRPTEAYEPLRSTRCPARAPFRLKLSPESTRKPPVHTRSTSRARSFDLEVTRWAPTRLTSCISHPGPAEAYEPLRSTLCPAHAPFRRLAVLESTHKPPVRNRSISKPRSFDLEVTP